MKRIFLVAMMACMVHFASAQVNQAYLQHRYMNSEDVEFIVINKAMLNFAKVMAWFDKQDLGGIKTLDSLEKIMIIESENEMGKMMLQQDVDYMVNDGYEVLMQTSEKGTQALFLLNTKNKPHEFVLYEKGATESTLLIIYGDFEMEDMVKMMESGKSH